ncbi:hypothetical protein OIU78_005427 [Salix suchowensis]|nr:hypothetical protein OIU78_005427 [Salix suchowensis]
MKRHRLTFHYQTRDRVAASSFVSPSPQSSPAKQGNVKHKKRPKPTVAIPNLPKSSLLLPLRYYKRMWRLVSRLIKFLSIEMALLCFLSGAYGLCVMYLYGRSSSKDDSIICRTVSIGSQIYFNGRNLIHVRKVSWHPYSDTHLGILSSDSVFRLFDLSSDVLQPEQEYYLQPVEPGRSRNAASICPVDFFFSGATTCGTSLVFSCYSAMVQFTSFAQLFHSKVSTNGNLFWRYIVMLKSTFPELAHESKEGELSTLRAHPYAIFDASLCLQGPLRKVCHGVEDEDLAVRGAECEGHAVSFLYDLASKDSILVTAWSGGQLQIDALSDEIQPVWTVGSPPRLRVNSHDHILGLAMLCESISGELPVVKLDNPHDHTVWLGHPPPLLRLAIVDLALPRKTESGSHISMFADPLMPERIYSVHDGGIDSIVLHFLPFTSQSSGKDETVRSPSVHPVLSTCQVENSTPSPLCGFIALSDSFGYSWIAVTTSNKECVVLEMKTLNLLVPVHVDKKKESASSEEWTNRNPPDFISKELLSGPKVVLVPQGSPNLRSVAADSIEGRSTLHQYLNLFHENYVEYAHKVYFELEHHGPQLKKIIDDQHARLAEAQEKLSKVVKKQSGLENRVNHAMHRHNLLEQRLHCLRNLPGVHKKPLSKAEREFKSELDQFTRVELDALRASIDTLRARLGRFRESSKGDAPNQHRKIAGKEQCPRCPNIATEILTHETLPCQ